MARINIEECWWTDPRRSALTVIFGSEELADARALRAWRLGQDFWKHGRQLVPKTLFDLLPGASNLVRVGLADVRESFVYVRGSSAYLDWTAEKRQQAIEAGKKSAEARRLKDGTAQPRPKKPRTKPERETNEPRTEFNDAEPSVSGSFSVSGSVSDSGSEIQKSSDGVLSEPPSQSKEEPPTRATWKAYSDAYFHKYGHEPKWNAKVGGQLASFVRQLGKPEAPLVAAFYLSHTKAFYVQNRHPVYAMLKDAEALYSQGKTGTKVTSIEAKQAEQEDFYIAQMNRIASGAL